MKKKLVSVMLSTAMLVTVLAGCGANNASQPAAEAPAAQESAAETPAAQEAPKQEDAASETASGEAICHSMAELTSR